MKKQKKLLIVVLVIIVVSFLYSMATYPLAKKILTDKYGYSSEPLLEFQDYNRPSEDELSIIPLAFFSLYKVKLAVDFCNGFSEYKGVLILNAIAIETNEYQKQLTACE